MEKNRPDRHNNTDRHKAKVMLVIAAAAADDDGFIITLCAKLSGAVYCNRSYLFAMGGVCGWVCYHNNLKLRASILTKLGL